MTELNNVCACAGPRAAKVDLQSRFQSPRYPYPAERETRDSGTKQFRMTRFLSWVQLRRRKRLDKMATNAEKVFHDGIEFSVAKLGNSNLELIAWRKEIY